MQRQVRDPHQKALAINLDRSQYGTIAEIGAGQETARWFFRVGGAAGSIAKAMSAYDMTFSDSIYGQARRYVSQDRLHAMVNHEYKLLIDRLDQARGVDTTFFAFANTVAARSYTYKTNGHGWLGIKFQSHPRAQPSQIIIHVNLFGSQNVQDQETLGVLGVNLIYAALHLHQQPEELLKSLMDDLYHELVEIDMIDFSGPDFQNVDNRLMALRLVQNGFSSAAMFRADGRVVQVSDALYKKAVLVERSRFRPPTRFTINLLDCAQEAFIEDAKLQRDEVMVLSEMTLKNLTEGADASDIDPQDFLYRADILCELGKNVLVSSYGEYYRLAQFLFRHVSKPIAIAAGLPTLRELFNEKYYEDLDGGILESFGRLFKNGLRLYVAPALDTVNGQQIGLKDLNIESHLQHLYSYLMENDSICELSNVNPGYLHIYSHEVLKKIQCGEAGWEEMVPEQVASMIRERHLFNCKL